MRGSMNQLNYHHLYYFYITALEGSVSRAAQRLHVTPQTISGQLTAFESQLGEPLFDRQSRRLLPNARGKMAFQYAQEIFGLGNELLDQLKQGQPRTSATFTIGVTDVIPKVFAFDLVAPLADDLTSTKLIYREGSLSSLVGDLALNRIDLILADQPLMNDANIKAFSHLLGQTGLSFFAAPALAEKLGSGFPQNLDGQPMLMPGEGATLRPLLHEWFEQQSIMPHVVAEFDDSALLKLFGQEGIGVFCVPTSIERHVARQYSVVVVGRVRSVKEKVYAISPERKVKHPLVRKIIEGADALLA